MESVPELNQDREIKVEVVERVGEWTDLEDRLSDLILGPALGRCLIVMFGFPTSV